MIISKLEKLTEKSAENYWQQRILGELKYAARLSEVNDGLYDGLVDSALDYLLEEKHKLIGEQEAKKCEDMLSELQAAAQEYTVICAAHAHIDMNWMWGWEETVSITIDTFRTILKLMAEYPDFKFSQSQASVYRIMENYAPEMLEQIKKKVHEGQWEVTASTWVEADKNVAGGESMVKHILYTKNYLADLLEIDPDSLNINFEPDTFGHSFNVPEVLTKGGVKYYYHCRGYDDYNLYRWQSQSGSSVLVNREGAWYNDQIVPAMAERVPGFCSRHNFDHLLKVYGVGDHGGGPTRRDLERLEDMKNWSIFPKVKFGTFGEYFQELEKIAENLPVVNDELNFVFTGCYSSQSRIKQGNRITENKLVDAEIFNSFADLTTDYSYNTEDFFQGWEKVLLNQFHDILPGSGSSETRQHALGLYQESLALSGSKRNLALNNLAENIATSSLVPEEEAPESRSEGAGAGFGVKDHQVSKTARGKGKKRLFHVFNSSPVVRCEVVEFVLWDWSGDKEQIKITDEEGIQVTHQVLTSGVNQYWGHKYIKLLVAVEVPPLGYSTYVVEEKKREKLPDLNDHNTRTEGIEDFCLENDKIKAEFDHQTGALTSLKDKTSGREYISEDDCGIFRLIDEDDSRGSTSWVVGRYMDIEPLDKKIKVKNVLQGPLKQAMQLKTNFRDSEMTVEISLQKNSSQLNFAVECDWQEKGEPGAKIPQLNFRVPLNYSCTNYKYDIPFGTIKRKGMRRDVPANSFSVGIPDDDFSLALMLVTDSRHGFRSQNDSLSATLIRSSYDPDPYPELGEHKFNFALVLQENNNQKLLQESYNYNHPLEVLSGSSHDGELKTQESFVSLKKGTVMLSDIKVPETKKDKKAWIIRVFETSGEPTEVVLDLFRQPEKACFVDLNEQEMGDQGKVNIKGRKISFSVEANSIASVKVVY